MKADEARTRGYAMPPAQPAAEPTTPQQAQSSPLVESAPFVIEGVITETHYAYGRVNLLEGILKGHKAQGLVTGIAGAAALKPTPHRSLPLMRSELDEAMEELAGG